MDRNRRIDSICTRYNSHLQQCAGISLLVAGILGIIIGLNGAYDAYVMRDLLPFTDWDRLVPFKIATILIDGFCAMFLGLRLNRW